MSNELYGENPYHRIPEVSWAMSIIPGLAGPKPRQKCVGDGQQVDIPAPVGQFTRCNEVAELARAYDLPCAAP
jgi:hypothetical protein